MVLYRLQMDGANNVKAESLRQIGPRRMMGDETPVGEPLRRATVPLQLTQLLEVGRVVTLEFSCMTWVHFDEGVGDGAA